MRILFLCFCALVCPLALALTQSYPTRLNAPQVRVSPQSSQVQIELPLSFHWLKCSVDHCFRRTKRKHVLDLDLAFKGEDYFVYSGKSTQALTLGQEEKKAILELRVDYIHALQSQDRYELRAKMYYVDQSQPWAWSWELSTTDLSKLNQHSLQPLAPLRVDERLWLPQLLIHGAR